MKRKKHTSIAVIQLRRHAAGAALVREGSQAVQCVAGTMSIDILSGDAALAGEEIRALLQSADIKARSCAVCVPADWLMTRTIEIPDLADSDLASLIEIEAERLFPYSPSDLAIAKSIFTDSTGRRFATLAAIPRNHLSAISAALQKARLVPVSISFGAALLAASTQSRAEAVLVFERDNIDFAITFGGSVAAIRSFHPVDVKDADDGAVADIARELLLTLQSFPAEERNALTVIRAYGSGDVIRSIVDRLNARLNAHDFIIELVSAGEATAVSTAGAVEAGRLLLEGEPATLEFFEPEQSVLRRRLDAFMKRSALRRASLVGGAIVLLIAAAFLFRHTRLAIMEARWSRIEEPVAKAEVVQEDIRKWRDWFDANPQTLDVMLALTSAFPETGEVWANTIQVEDRSTVMCSGAARSNKDYLAFFDALRKSKGIEDLKVEQVRGEKPIQFSLTFRWTGRSGG